VATKKLTMWVAADEDGDWVAGRTKAEALSRYKNIYMSSSTQVRPLSVFKMVIDNAPLPTTVQLDINLAAEHTDKVAVAMREIDIEPENTVIGGGN